MTLAPKPAISDLLASARVLAAYGFGLFAIVLIRSAVASFQARGDTRTPMMVSLAAVGFNVMLKLALFQPLGAEGLAIATAAGAWVNFGLLVFLARRQGAMRFDALLGKVVLASGLACVALAAVALAGRAPAEALAQGFGRCLDTVTLVVIALASQQLGRLTLLSLIGFVYFLGVFLLDHVQRPKRLVQPVDWVKVFRNSRLIAGEPAVLDAALVVG